MNNIWQKIVKEFLSWTRSDRNAVMLLAVMVVVVLGVNEIVKTFDSEPLCTPEDFDRIIAEWDAARNEIPEETSLFFTPFNPNTITAAELDSFPLSHNIKRNLLKYRAAGGFFYSKNDVRKLYGMNDSIFMSIEPFIIVEKKRERRYVGKSGVARKRKAKKKETMPQGTFDPNVADKEELKRFGLNSYQAGNIEAYRKKGGFFKNKTDLLKIYGLDSVTYKKIHPYISIRVEKETKPKNYMQDIYVELNTADTSDLIELHGIGSVFAWRIVKYRELLGGFSSKQQLLEVYGMDNERFERIKNNITVDSLKISRLRINYAGFSELLRHPYLSKQMVKAIMKEKENNGPLKNISDLEKLKGFDIETVEKIRPYILF